MKWSFPVIRIHKTAKQQILKVVEETEEFLTAKRKHAKDIEAIDVYHAAETLLRIQFKDREDQLDDLINEVIEKNRRRGKYS